MVRANSASAAASSTYAVSEIPVSFPYSWGVAADPATDTVYAGVQWALAVIDGATNTTTSYVRVNIIPQTVVVDPASNTVYAFENGVLVVVSGASRTVTAQLSMPCSGYGCAAVNAVKDKVYSAAGSTVWVLDGKTNVVSHFSIASTGVTPSSAGVAVDTATNTIYVSDFRDNQVVVIDGATDTVTGRIALPTGSAPLGLTADPSTGKVYVADSGTGAISVIDTTTDGVSTLASGLSVPLDLALDASTGTLDVTTTGGSSYDLGTTYAIDTASGMIAAQIPRGGSAITGMPGGPVYVNEADTLSPEAGDVTAIRPSTANTMSPLIVSGWPGSVTVGQPVDSQLVASAIPAATFSATTGLPPGLSLSASGLLTGTPAPGTGGLYFPNLTATNGIAPTDTPETELQVNQAPAITSTDHTTFGAGTSGAFSMSATGFPAPTFSETGTLPAGVTLESPGVLTGTPAVGSAGQYPITVTATNSTGSAMQAFTLTVAAPPAVAVAGLGAGGVPYARAPQLDSGTAWQSLGGTVTAPPAVAAEPNPAGDSPVSPLFIAPGTNHLLYIRGVTGSWQRLGPKDASCLAAAAAVTGTALTVACEGLNHALYYDTAAMPASGLPQFTNSWAGLGGTISAGPAVAPVGGVVTFFVRGTNGIIYTRTLKTGFSRAAWSCLGAPAAALQASTGVTVFACQGDNHLLYEAANSGTGWGKTTGLGGATLAAGPAIAATTGAIEFLADLTNHSVAARTTTTNWTSLGGTITGGIQATALN